MRKMTRKHLTVAGCVLGALSCVALSGHDAQAKLFPTPVHNLVDGFICDVEFIPNSAILDSTHNASGDSGLIAFDVTSAANCGGSVVLTSATLCTLGASSGTCEPDSLYNGSEILAVYQEMVAARADNLRVEVDFHPGVGFFYLSIGN